MGFKAKGNENLGFTRSYYDMCLYFKGSKLDDVIYLLLYVDDMLIISKERSKPDLTYAISVLSKYMSNPGREHWNAMKWDFSYLKGSTDTGLKFTKRPNNTLIEGYSDANYAGDRDSRKSTSVDFFLLGGNCVSWRVQLQLVVVLSTTESEYVSIT
ncbi:secreted RxLR effector protein 161-like [Humulus lupulus]|uniref:secreted RxLR effector protein 161-like n=1 Tax=Humulus lupulus TaxID=3486 RepID=UPI002B413FED|nr:secreted RxLR effector protein 161-like [Humulus lupulus]